MNADDPDSRRVQWTQPARADMKFLVDRRGFTREDFRRLVANLERIAALAVGRIWRVMRSTCGRSVAVNSTRRCGT